MACGRKQRNDCFGGAIMTKSFASRASAFLATLAVLSLAASPVSAYQATQRITQPEQRAPSGQLTVEGAVITVVVCNGAGENGGQRYIYQYLGRAGFRAISPPNWGQAIGGHDWATFDQAVGAACTAQAMGPMPAGPFVGIGGQWRLATTCTGRDGLQSGQSWAAIMNIADAGGGSLQVSTSNDPLNVDPATGNLSGNTFTVTLHPRGWASNLEFTGTGSGASITGRIHHYTNDDCNFSLTR